MSEFINSLFDNKKQKFTWIIYIIVLIINYSDVSSYNSNQLCVLKERGCRSLFTEVIIFTIVFAILALILRKVNFFTYKHNGEDSEIKHSKM